MIVCTKGFLSCFVVEWVVGVNGSSLQSRFDLDWIRERGAHFAYPNTAILRFVLVVGIVVSADFLHF